MISTHVFSNNAWMPHLDVLLEPAGSVSGASADFDFGIGNMADLSCRSESKPAMGTLNVVARERRCGIHAELLLAFWASIGFKPVTS